MCAGEGFIEKSVDAEGFELADLSIFHPAAGDDDAGVWDENSGFTGERQPVHFGHVQVSENDAQMLLMGGNGGERVLSALGDDDAKV